MTQTKQNWEDKLIDLVEKEIELASGVKSKEHFSGECKMNDILELVRKTRQTAKLEVLGKLEKRESINLKDASCDECGEQYCRCPERTNDGWEEERGKMWQEIKAKINKLKES